MFIIATSIAHLSGIEFILHLKLVLLFHVLTSPLGGLNFVPAKVINNENNKIPRHVLMVK